MLSLYFATPEETAAIEANILNGKYEGCRRRLSVSATMFLWKIASTGIDFPGNWLTHRQISNILNIMHMIKREILWRKF